jgi:hypothetical protein
MSLHLPRPAPAQRGMASLITVMVLFFVVAMVAAYTSRNMIFEQRTSVNQLRSTQALEAAQSGFEWAVGLLNAGRVTAACVPSAVVTDDSFRQRYLNIDPDSAAVTPRKRSDATDLIAACVATTSGWACSCPSDASWSLTAPTDTDIRPAFAVRFIAVPRVRTVRVEVNGCTRLDAACLSFAPADRSGSTDGRAFVSAVVSMKSGLPTMPTAAITARGNVSGDVHAYNTDVAVAGITVQSGALVTVPDTKLHSVAGTPPESSKVENEPLFASAKLAGAAASIGDRMFAAHFGLWPNTYRDQPATVVLTCAPTCNDAALRTAIANNPTRMVWVSGNLSIDTAADIGSATEPVMIFTTGSVTFTVAATVHGVIYGGRDPTVAPGDFNLTGAGTIRGALIAEHAMVGAGDTNVVFDAAVLKRIRQTTGSFVLVPGTWRDFR